MLYDDIDDPLAGLGANRNQVKGFIKTGQKKEAGERKKRTKKVKDDGDKVYESVARSKVHDKYENEIDSLINQDTSLKENGEAK